jgi:predicted AAA+ superfamily ATPase
MIKRLINIPKDESFFLLGARGTGKTSLLKQLFGPEEALYIDLLKPAEFSELSLNPDSLLARMAGLPDTTSWVIIDEIQKLPKLLDLVHHQIENTKYKFALTGSSARKLKRGAANLLAGRAVVYNLFPLTSRELESSFNLDESLSWGTLPLILAAKNPSTRIKKLRTYAHTYLKEEIQQEQLVRTLEPFHRFLLVAAQSNGTILNYSAIGRDCGVGEKTVQEYFKILEDTLVGTILPAFHESIRKRQSHNPKFYFFDCGVQRALAQTLRLVPEPHSFTFGRAFETFIVNEVVRLQSYQELDFSLSYLRTKDDAEIDLIVERPGMPRALIEIKSSTSIKEQDVSTLQRLHRDFRNSEAFCFSLDPHAKKFGPVRALHWRDGLKEIGL